MIMCQILHNQYAEQYASLEQIIKAAVVSDKYGCAVNVLGRIVTPLRKYVSKFGTESNAGNLSPVALGNVLNLAYLAEDQDLLWQASRLLLAGACTSSKVDCDPRSVHLVPTKLSGGYPFLLLCRH